MTIHHIQTKDELLNDLYPTEGFEKDLRMRIGVRVARLSWRLA